MSRLLLTTFLILLLSGCKLLPESRGNASAPVENSVTADEFCVQPEANSAHDCDLGYWVNYWIAQGSKPWSVRKQKITELSKTPGDTLRKVLLSHGKGTPYQDRLRAQTWTEQLLPGMSDKMATFVHLVIYQTSQELLEFESALAILTRVNAQQAKQLEEQMSKLETQQAQLEQLLKIEASMMQKREGISQ